MSAIAIDKSLLKDLVPPQSLNSENFEELARKAVFESLDAGKLVFKAGAQDRQTVYVIEGEVELIGEGESVVVVGGSEEARHAIANQQPRRVTARAKTDVSVVRFDSDLLDILLTWDQLSGIEVSDISVADEHPKRGSEDWMTRILHSKAFLRIPPANIQTMFMRLKEHPVKAGDVILSQGERGDYYYILCRGKCTVSREAENGKVALATLSDGAAFGEEALLAEGKRNATVTMDTDGLLMRLSKQDFAELLREPMVQEVELPEAKAMVKEGAVMLDVRMESEFKAGSIKGSVNLPLFALRMKARHLDSERKYICFCSTGRRSSAAAFLLSEFGISSFVLKGGLQALHKPNA